MKKTPDPILGTTVDDDSSEAVVTIDVDRLIDTRLVITAMSGSGKSHAIRRILEQTYGKIQQIVIDPEGEFYCVVPDTPVLLGDGSLIAAGDLQAGDVVISFDVKSGSYSSQKVLRVSKQEVDELWEISASLKRTLTGTANHKLLTRPSRFARGYSWKPLAEIKVGDYIAIPDRVPYPDNKTFVWKKPMWTTVSGNELRYKAPTQVSPFLSVIELPDFDDQRLFEFLGYFLSDGHLTKDNPFFLLDAEPSQGEIALADQLARHVRAELGDIEYPHVSPNSSPTAIFANHKLQYLLIRAGKTSRDNAKEDSIDAGTLALLRLAEIWDKVPPEAQDELIAKFPELSTLPKEALPSPGILDIDNLPAIEELETSSAQWLIADWIVDGNLIVFSGDPGCGKSYLAAAILGAISSGHHWCDREVTQAPCVYLERDGQQPDLFKQRFRQLGIKSGRNLKVYGTWISDVPFATDPRLLAWVRKHRRCVIVVDAQVAFLRGFKENDNDQMRQFYDEWRALTRLGATVIILHHTGKGEGARRRGASDIAASPDALYYVEKTNREMELRTMTVTCDKSRRLLTQKFHLCLLDDGSGFVEDTEHRDKATSRKDRYLEAFRELLRNNPGITKKGFEDLAQQKQLGRDRARKFLADGIKENVIEQKPGPNNAQLHKLMGDVP